MVKHKIGFLTVCVVSIQIAVFGMEKPVIAKYSATRGFYNDFTIKVEKTDLKTVCEQDLTKSQKLALQFIREQRVQKEVITIEDLSQELLEHIAGYIPNVAIDIENKDVPQALCSYLKLLIRAQEYPLLALCKKHIKKEYIECENHINFNLALYSTNLKLLNCLPEVVKQDIGRKHIEDIGSEKPFIGVFKELENDALKGIPTKKNFFNLAVFMSLVASVKQGNIEHNMATNYVKIKHARTLLELYPHALKGIDNDNPFLDEMADLVNDLKWYLGKKRKWQDE